MGREVVRLATQCATDDLTDVLSWFLQGLLAALAFACLILKRFCEPRYKRRPWLIWFYDTSKQGIGALVIHMANVFLASHFHGDPCTWYIISFLLDSFLGLFVIYFSIRLCQHLALTKNWDSINFGNYGHPPSSRRWLTQCALYVAFMLGVKLITAVLAAFRFWDGARSLVPRPGADPRLELALVILVVPFCVNVLMFWVTDNFLMLHHPRVAAERFPEKVRYRALGSDSGDEDLLGSQETLARNA